MRKNINPKTLKGSDKLNRTLELMNKMTTLNESTSTSELELIKKAADGIVYGIVRENHKYFIKHTDKTSGEFTANDFHYIGGLQNKLNESYPSYSEALKHLNLKFDTINESMGIEGNINIFESDGVAFGGGTGFGFVMEEDDEDIEEQEYKIKVDAPKQEPAPAPAPSPMDAPVEDEVDVEPSDEFGDLPTDDLGDETDGDIEDEDGDPTKKIQKMTGKLGQMIREMEEPDGELEKYVINSVISAMHLDLLSEEDIEDIVAKLEGEEEEDRENAEDDLSFGDDEPAADTELDEPETEEEPVADVTEESVKLTKGELLESLTKDILKDTLNESESLTDYMPSGKKAGKSYKKRRENLKRKARKKRRNEHHDMDYDDYGKYDHDEYKMMDEDFDMIVSDNDFENVESAYVDCPECAGDGCPHCDFNGYHLSGTFDDEGIADDFMTIDASTGEYGPYDRDGDEIPSRVDMDDDNDGYIDDRDGQTFGVVDEEDGFDVSIADSISGTFQDDDVMMYDPQSGGEGPFDRDGDGIPSRLDLDADGDGDIDGTADDLDIRYFDDPITKPRPKEPVVVPGKPGEKKRRGPWEKPKTKPRPKAEGGDVAPSVRRSFRKKGFFK
jgi:hypothetical protein